MSKVFIWLYNFSASVIRLSEEEFNKTIELMAYELPAEDGTAKPVFSGTLNEFKTFINNIPAGSDISLFIPAKNVLYTQVSIPGKSRTHLLKALPFLLEDYLIEAVEQQHFSLGEINQGQCNVAIVSKQLMQRICQQFKDLSLPPSRLSSDIFFLPWHKNTWTIGFPGDTFIIRTDEQKGISSSVDNFEFILSLLLDSANSEPNEKPINAYPDNIIIYATQDNKYLPVIQSLLNSYSDINIEMIDTDIIEYIEQGHINQSNYLTHTGINLMQGDYRPEHLQKIKIPYKKTLLVFLLLFIISQASFMFYQWSNYKQTLKQLNTELSELFFDTFKGSKRLIDVRTQTLNKLKQLQSQVQADDSFLNLLALVGNEIRKNKAISVQSITYRDGVLQLKLISSDFIFKKLKATLEKQYPVRVEEKSSSVSKGKIHSLLTIRSSS